MYTKRISHIKRDEKKSERKKIKVMKFNTYYADLPFKSSSSKVVLESVDSFSFTCDPSLFFAIMLLPLNEERRKRENCV